MRQNLFYKVFSNLFFTLVFITVASASFAGSISGTVTDKDTGDLLVGVNVSASIGGNAEETTTTDSSGQYSFINLPAGRYQIYFNSDGYLGDQYEETVIVGTSDNILGIDIQLVKKPERTGYKISGIVKGANGEELSGISVRTCDYEGDYCSSVVTDGTGHFTLGEQYKLWAGGHILRFSDPDSNAFLYYKNSTTYAGATRVQVNADTETIIDDVIFDTTNNGFISGTVTDKETGNPLAGVYVSALISGGNENETIITDSLGQYSFSKLPVGEYHVTFGKNKYLNNEKIVIIGAGDNILGIDIQLAKRIGEKISGTVMDANGQALAGFEVRTCDDWGDYCSSVVTDSTGHFTLSELWIGKHILRFSDPNSNAFLYYKNSATRAGATPIQVQAESETVIEMVMLQGTESLSGVVKDASGNPLENVIVKAYQSNDGDWSSVTDENYIATTSTDALGHYQFSYLDAGTYRVKFEYVAISSRKSSRKSFQYLPSSSVNGIEYYRDANNLQDATDITVNTGEVNVIKDVLIGAPDLETEVEVTVIASDDIASEEGDTGEFTVSRTGDTTSPLTVFFTLGGTAEAGVDYQSIGNSVTIPAGTNFAKIKVVPINDADTLEGDEVVVMTLQDPVQGRKIAEKMVELGVAKKVVGSSATITIVNNVNAQAIPTLQEWALILLSLLLIFTSKLYSRQSVNRFLLERKNIKA